ncbi:helix-turn-helix domain-containing protein [Chryseobacterium sp. MIQD13]|uniref:helix-turn-helix domain-containing protein n=1 Tax=Chryseobacterium sp. MIQD13 TaxID=3422310 RepID=UPI003D2CDF8C
MKPPEIKLFFSCTSQKYTSDENVVPAHSLTFIYEGNFEITDASGTLLLESGSLFFTAKNDIFRFTKLASKDRPYKSVSVIFSEQFLKEYFEKNEPSFSGIEVSKSFVLNKHTLTDNLFSSLKPYVDMEENLPEYLCDLKRMEALGILRTFYPGIDRHLLNFEDPGKIDLEAFMKKNYIFNLPLQKFAYLTGRSISTFKRDFFKIFEITPQRWLTKKRLEHAHFLIDKQQLKPSEAFINSGFENLSHFSRAFKAEFGYSPKTLLNV